MIANYHTHTVRCGHACDEDEAYIQRAIEGGLQVLGFSDHSPWIFPNGYEPGYCVPTARAEEYISSLRTLRDKYKGDIDIRIGFEMEYYPTYFADMLAYVKQLGAEYLILGQHFIGDGHPGAEYSGAGCEHTEQQLTRYTDQVIAAMNTGKFLYVAHPDLLYYPEDDTTYRREATRLCEQAKALRVPLEINFLGITDGRHYPDPRFWEVAGEVGCDVIFGCDAHSAARAYDAESLVVAKDMVKRYGLKLVDRLDIAGL